MRQIWPGRAHPLGATFDGGGVNFAVFSRVATRIEVCLYDPEQPERELERFDLPELTEYTRHGYIPGLQPGMLYGLRVHGAYAPEQGHRCNPHKLLVDPYAKAVCGTVDWKKPVFGYKLGDEHADLSFDESDSADGMPKSVVVNDAFDWGDDRHPGIPWRQTVIYETHVRGFTQRHPEIPEELRGTYAGLAHPAAIRHLTELGVTAVELLPVHEFPDDGYLVDKQLHNYWGYSTLAFFAPAQRYSQRSAPGSQVAEFKAMVKALHAAGIEVILDVVYNHTCEGNQLGPTLSLKGIDNASYYWLMPEARYYLDFTGTGNSVNASSAETARLILDSLRYWVNEMHVDGFRFDLATTIGRVGRGQYDRHAPIFQVIDQDPVLSRVKLIAEPWDVGLGGYQVGNFPSPFREWNGKFRDAIRRYWKGDKNLASELGYRLSGSADLFQGDRRAPQASINFITSHDGFTLHDLVTYNDKHNDANGENNQDGADDNQSWNHGHEGETDDPAIITLREQQKRNLLATLLLSQGVPMLLGGDEFGRTQGGNNNAYCQDNEVSWFDWTLDDRRRQLFDFTRRLIALRRRHPVLQRRRFFEGDFVWESESKDLTWLRPDGHEMSPLDWQKPWISVLGFKLGGDAIPMTDERGERLLDDDMLVLMNAHYEPMTFQLPAENGSTWQLEFDTGLPDKPSEAPCSGSYEVAARAMVLLRQDQETRVSSPVRAPNRADRRQRRAGVVMPLFAIRSGSSWGIGEIGDLPHFAKWAHQAGFSVLQLLPVNDVSGTGPSPYAPVSAFALDPAYLSLDACEDFQAAGGREALTAEQQTQLTAANAATRIDWSQVRELKRAGIAVAFERFMREEWSSKSQRATQLVSFMKEQRAWLDDYALFCALHEKYNACWLDWPHGARDRDPGAIAAAREEQRDALLRHKWLQWQLDGQWRRARRDASAHGVELMGDLPFTVAIDSADVWADRDLFRIDQHVASAPDATSPQGHDWGLPVYDWAALARDDFSWVKARAMRAGELFGLCRVDHVIGLYRTYFKSVDGRSEGFTPYREAAQLLLGETLLRIMSRWAEVVAEDLGMVPPFLRPSLERLAIPGYRVLRWEKESGSYRDPQTWPSASVATFATHDTESMADWYDSLSVEERGNLRRLPGLGELDPERAFDDLARDRLLAALYKTPSTLAIIQFQDAMGTRERINVPGAADGSNWTFRADKTVEQLEADLQDTQRLAKLAQEADRVPTDT